MGEDELASEKEGEKGRSEMIRGICGDGKQW